MSAKASNPFVSSIEELAACPECNFEWKYTVPCYKCKGTGYGEDGEICDTHSCSYNRETEKFDGECTAHCCKDGIQGPFSRIIGMQVQGVYDGVSEWLCPSCETRWGRWTGKKLADGQNEKRFGEQ